MRKISIFILAFASLFVFTACPDTPELLPPSNPQEADSQAYAAYIEHCSNPGGAYSEICEQGANMDAAQASAEFANGNYSSNSSSQGLNKYDENEALLPEKYKIKNNPYEKSGVAHNRILFYLMNARKGKSTREFLDGNDFALDRIATIICESHNIDSKKMVQIKENIRPMTTNSYFDQHISKYKNISRSTLFSSSTLSPTMASYCLKIVKEVEISERDAKSNKTLSVIDYINSKIIETLNLEESLSKEKNIKLGFLSVLKHSYYYWNN